MWSCQQLTLMVNQMTKTFIFQILMEKKLMEKENIILHTTRHRHSVGLQNYLFSQKIVTISFP